MGQDRISLMIFIFPENRLAAADRDCVEMFGSAFGNHQIVIAILLVQMRTFRGFGVYLSPGPDDVALADQLESGQIDFGAPDALPGPCFIIKTGRPCVVAFSVIIPEQGRIDAVRTLDDVHVRPGSGRIGGGDDKIDNAHAHIGRDQIKRAVMVTDGRGKNACRDHFMRQRQLFGAIQHVPDLFPLLQIFAVEDRHARKITEAGSDEIEIIPDPTDRRIRVKTRQNRIPDHSFTLSETRKV